MMRLLIASQVSYSVGSPASFQPCMPPSIKLGDYTKVV